jgi:hypothetical protein
MSKLSGSETAVSLNLKQWMLLVAAGLGSFLLPFWMHREAQLEDDLVTPVSREQRQKMARTAAPGANAGMAAEATPSAENAQTSSSRMNRVVVRDPFGQLMPDSVAISAPPPPPPPVQRKPVAKVVVAAGPPAPPPAPVAPPLPFTAVGFIQGQRIGDGQQQTFIQQGEKLTVIRQGDTINNTYRVDAITAERIVVTYLPLGQKQTLPLLDNLK